MRKTISYIFRVGMLLLLAACLLVPTQAACDASREVAQQHIDSGIAQKNAFEMVQVEVDGKLDQIEEKFDFVEFQMEHLMSVPENEIPEVTVQGCSNKTVKENLHIATLAMKAQNGYAQMTSELKSVSSTLDDLLVQDDLTYGGLMGAVQKAIDAVQASK